MSLLYLRPAVYVESSIKNETDKMRVILNKVSNYFEVSEDKILDQNRAQRVKEARFVFSYLSRRYTDASLPTIGRFIKKDHSSIIHQVKAVSNWIETDTRFRIKYNGIERRVFKALEGTFSEHTIKAYYSRKRDYEELTIQEINDIKHLVDNYQPTEKIQNKFSVSKDVIFKIKNSKVEEVL